MPDGSGKHIFRAAAKKKRRASGPAAPRPPPGGAGSRFLPLFGAVPLPDLFDFLLHPVLGVDVQPVQGAVDRTEKFIAENVPPEVILDESEAALTDVELRVQPLPRLGKRELRLRDFPPFFAEHEVPRLHAENFTVVEGDLDRHLFRIDGHVSLLAGHHERRHVAVFVIVDRRHVPVSVLGEKLPRMADRLGGAELLFAHLPLVVEPDQMAPLFREVGLDEPPVLLDAGRIGHGFGSAPVLRHLHLPVGTKLEKGPRLVRNLPGSCGPAGQAAEIEGADLFRHVRPEIDLVVLGHLPVHEPEPVNDAVVQLLLFPGERHLHIHPAEVFVQHIFLDRPHFPGQFAGAPVQFLERLELLVGDRLHAHVPDGHLVCKIGQVGEKLLGFVERQERKRQLADFVLRLVRQTPGVHEAFPVEVLRPGVDGQRIAELIVQLVQIEGKVVERPLVLVFRLDQDRILFLVLLVAPYAHADQGRRKHGKQDGAQSRVHVDPPSSIPLA